MGIIDNAKEVADLIKVAGNTDLYRKICALEGEIIDLTRTNRHLEEQVESLQKLLEKKAKLIWDKTVYRIEGESDPYCPRCWEASEKAIHLAIALNQESWHCLNCDRFFLS